MAISSVSPSISSVSSPVSDSAISALVQNARKSQDQQLSTIVSLSTQGQQLSRAAAPVQAAPIQPTAPTQTPTAPTQTAPAQNVTTETSQSQQSNSVGTPAAENVETRAKEATESSGIQLLEGESKGGRISTYA